MFGAGLQLCNLIPIIQLLFDQPISCDLCFYPLKSLVSTSLHKEKPTKSKNCLVKLSRV